MPSVEGKNDTEDEDMEQDTMESDKSEDDEYESVSGSEYESSELDEVECDKRRDDCLLDMMELEKVFASLKENLYTERMAFIELRLSEARAETATEYLLPLEELQKNYKIRTEVAAILKNMRVQNIKYDHEAEKQAAIQHYDSEKQLLFDSVKSDLEDKIRRLEEDRHNIDISSDLWNESQENQKSRNKKSSSSGDRRRKPVTVSGPYIVYMLEDNDIIDDWTEVMKALKQTQRQEFSAKHNARFENGSLYYDGTFYSEGDRIVIDHRHDSPVIAQVNTINENEVWVKRTDGTKSKLFITQLQKGKYSIKHFNLMDH